MDSGMVGKFSNLTTVPVIFSVGLGAIVGIGDGMDAGKGVGGSGVSVAVGTGARVSIGVGVGGPGVGIAVGTRYKLIPATKIMPPIIPRVCCRAGGIVISAYLLTSLPAKANSIKAKPAITRMLGTGVSFIALIASTKSIGVLPSRLSCRTIPNCRHKNKAKFPITKPKMPYRIFG